MNFKISNIIDDKISKIADQVEVISGAATLVPSIPITKLISTTSSYEVYLPNGNIGQQKIVTTVGGNANVTIRFNSGYRNSGEDTITMYDEGDLIVFWASIKGWHYEARIYD